jgi:uncharacterized damage-inducible protein DinB
MSEMLRDFYAHQAWADAEHWRAILALPEAAADTALRDRLHHIFLVQRAFLALARGQAPVLDRPGDYPDLASMRDAVTKFHREAADVVTGLTAAALAERVAIPWFTDAQEAVLKVSVEQALTQAAMHSHYHRGQNATRLRELGGEPPLTDLIVWWWKGRPAAEW